MDRIKGEKIMLDVILEIIIVSVLLLFTITIIERLRFSSGKELLVDKILVFLEGIHRKTAPKNEEGMDCEEYPLTEKVKIRNLYFREIKKD